MLSRSVYRCLACLALATAALAEPITLCDGDQPDAWKTSGPATVAAGEPGTLQVGLPGTATFTITGRATAAMSGWDQYQGLSFMVKGDGSDHFGCLAVAGGGSDGSYSYVTWFPLADTNWHKVTVSWDDLVPENQANPIGAAGSLPPSGITVLRCGSRWTIGHNNYPLPTVSFGLDQVQLEETVPAPAATPKLRPFADVVAKLKAGQPVRIQCMGDSITAGTSLPDRDHQRYAVLTGELLRQWLKNDAIECESRAVGGAKLTDARAWVPRDFDGPAPDLVTVLYGYNDKSNLHTRAYYQASLNDYLDRIARITNGQTAVLLLTCLPGCGPRWSMLDDFADAVRETAKERGLACFEFQQVLKSLGREGIEPLFADQAHPNVEGHEALAYALASHLAEQAGVTPPPPAAKPVVEAGPDQAWNFDAGLAGWQLDGTDVKLVNEGTKSGTHALRYHMTGDAPDHRRAWSPKLAVKPGQQYRISAEVFFEQTGTGKMGLYVGYLPAMDSPEQPQIQAVRAASGLVGQWETVANEITVPDGAGAMTVLVWSPKDGTGAYRVDDVKVVGR